MQVRKTRVPVDRIGSAHVAVLIGGAFQSAVETPESLRCDAVVYIDVASEIRAVVAGHQVLLQSLASGETIGTLMLGADCNAQLREYCRQHSAVNLADGLAQIRGVGDQIMKLYVATPEFREFLRRDLFGPLMEQHNGAIDELTLLLLASDAGATGGPGRPIVSPAICDIFLEHFDATVQLDAFRCGSMTYEGIGDRVHANHAATLAENVAWVTSSDRHPREVRRLFLTDLPMVNEDRAARGRFARELAQAFCCQAIRRRFGLHAPNAAFDSRLGAIKILRGHWHRSLAPREIAAEVAQQYQQSLREAVHTAPGDQVVKSVTVSLADSNRFTVRSSVDELIRRASGARGSEPAGFEEDCTEVKYDGGGTVTAEMVDGRKLNLTHGARAFASHPCETIGEYEKMFSETKGLQKALATEIQSVKSSTGDLRHANETDLLELSDLRSQLFPRGVFRRSCQWLRGQLFDPEILLVQLRSVVEKIRQTNSKIAQLERTEMLLQDAAHDLAAEHAAERARLDCAINKLGPIGSSQRSHRQRLVTVAPINDVLVELLEIANDDTCDSGELVRLLSTRVSEVTIYGLAQIAGMEVKGGVPIRAATIASRLVDEDVSIAAPPWGGNRNYPTGQQVIVLPPVSQELAQEIRTHVKRISETTSVVAGDSACGGANVIKLEIFSPRRNRDIFTKFTLKNLEVALEAPELFFPNGTSCVEELGLLELLHRDSEVPAHSTLKSCTPK